MWAQGACVPERGVEHLGGGCRPKQVAAASAAAGGRGGPAAPCGRGPLHQPGRGGGGAGSSRAFPGGCWRGGADLERGAPRGGTGEGRASGTGARLPDSTPKKDGWRKETKKSPAFSGRLRSRVGEAESPAACLGPLHLPPGRCPSLREPLLGSPASFRPGPLPVSRNRRFCGRGAASQEGVTGFPPRRKEVAEEKRNVASVCGPGCAGSCVSKEWLERRGSVDVCISPWL